MWAEIYSHNSVAYKNEKLEATYLSKKLWLAHINKLWSVEWHPTPVLLPGKSHGRRSLVGCSPWGREESDTTERLHFHFSLSCIGEGNGNPLQCSCLQNPRDVEAWWAHVYGVAQSQTWLKWWTQVCNPGWSSEWTETPWLNLPALSWMIDH